MLAVILGIALISGCASDPSAQRMGEGWAALQAGNYAGARAVADELAESPRAAEALYLKGRALEQEPVQSKAQQRENLLAAGATYRSALAAGPNDELTGRIYAGMGNIAYWQEDFAEAWRSWVKAYDYTTEDNSKSYILYRIGLCQQRLGRFDEADRTFAAVQQNFPGSEASRRAGEKKGARAFTLQVATFATPQGADNAMVTLRREGFVAGRQPNSQGQQVIFITPFPNYQQAVQAREKLAGSFPDALIVP